MSEPTHGQASLAAATSVLRAHTDNGWRAVRPGLIDRVRAAVRPSAPVRGRHGAGEFTVACDVLAHHVGRVVDAVPSISVHRVSCVAGADQDLETVLVEVAVEFGTELLAVSRSVRSATHAEIERVIGFRVPDQVVLVDVHVADVYRSGQRG